MDTTTAKPSTQSTTKETTPQKVKVNDSELGEIEITPASYPKNTYENLDNFTNSGQLNDTNFTLRKGIDVSSYSGEIDWQKVKNESIEFAIIRIGGRGYGDSGILYEDKTALENIKNAKNAGIDVGVYFYSQAITEEEAKEEAQFVLDTLNGENLQLPVCYDFEFIENDVARTDNVTGEQMTKFAKAFFSKIENAGYKTMLYGESHDFYNRYDLSQFPDTPIWYAEYSNKPDFYYDFYIWQYSSTGNIDGVSGSVDLNFMFIKAGSPRSQSEQIG